MKKFKKNVQKVICFFFAHVLVKVVEIDNGRSKYGYLLCGRCDHQEDYQYDYG